MKKFNKFMALGVAISMSASLFAGQASAASYETEINYGVNLREDPSTSSSVYRMLSKGEDIHVIDKINNYWLKIQTKDGKVGYISANEKYTDYDESKYITFETNINYGVNFRNKPNANSSVYRMLSKGEDVHVIEQINDYWLKIQTKDGKIGYISANEKYTDYNDATYATATSGVNFRSGPKVTSNKIGFISRHDQVKVIEEVNQYWLKVNYNGNIGYASANYFDYKAPSKPAPNAKANEIIKTAKSYLGDFKYKWGAEPWNTNNKYSDCSAFVQLVFNRNHGYNLPRVSRNQAKEGNYVNKSNLKLGDLVFFDTINNGTINHVGIYIGAGEFIHSSPINEVGINNLNVGYWKDHYETARRVL